METEDSGSKTPGGIRGVIAAVPMKKGSHGGGGGVPPLRNFPVRQLQDDWGRIAQIKTRLLISGVHSRGVVARPQPTSLSGHRRVSLKGLCLVPITLTSLPSHDSVGSIICGLLSSPDVLLCHVRDWRDPSEAQAKAACPGVTYEQDSRQATLRLGGQEFKSKPLPSARVRSFTMSCPHQQGLLLCCEPSPYPEVFILLKRNCTQDGQKKQPEHLSSAPREA